MNLSAPFIARPVATTLLSLSVVLVGALGYTLLPVSPLPQVDFPAITVSASLPGASPETMASSVATPLERALGTIAGVNEISSQSSQGSTRINIQFDLGKNIDSAAREVQAAINASRSLLPSALPGMPSYRKINPSQAPIMLLALTSDTATTSQLYDLASTVLAQKVAQVTGVGDVTVGGGSLPAVRVELQPQALTQYGISLDEVRQAISSANLRRPKGMVEDSERHWQIQASDQLVTAEQYQPLIITYRNGAPVRLSDVARVYNGVEDRYNSGYFNDKPAVLLVVSRQAQANIIATVDGVTAQLPALRAFLPAGVSLDIASDRSPTIRATLREAQQHAAHRRRPRHPRRAAVPGQAARGDDPGGGRAGGPGRQLCGDVSLGLLAEQPVADGAHRRDRPRRGRRDRGAGEHQPPRRGGEDAAAPPRLPAPGKSASPCCR